MGKIFTDLCKVAPENVVSLSNVKNPSMLKKSLADFKTHLEDKDTLAIIYYSGHGASDGALLMCNGQKYSSKELKAFVNSYENDTVLIFDMCFSGNIEKSQNIETVKRIKTQFRGGFRQNTIRMYSARENTQARQIVYNGRDSIIFKGEENIRTMNKSFFQSVLKITDRQIKFNSLFTALFVAYFADATVNLDTKKNYSFHDISIYIQNKEGHFLDPINQKLQGQELSEDELTENRITKAYIQSQEHDIMPLSKNEVEFKNSFNQYLLLNRISFPIYNFFSLGADFRVSFPLFATGEAISIGVNPSLFFDYNIVFEPLIISFGSRLGFSYSHSKEEHLPGVLDFDIYSIMLGVRNSYRTNFGYFLYAIVGYDLGLNIMLIRYEQEYEKDINSSRFYLSFDAGLGFAISGKIAINLLFNFTSIFLDNEDKIYSFYPGVNIAYNF